MLHTAGLKQSVLKGYKANQLSVKSGIKTPFVWDEIVSWLWLSNARCPWIHAYCMLILLSCITLLFFLASMMYNSILYSVSI